ncbi:single-stranded DNA-binding protein, partial [Butyricicoccus sp. 1XD8-22]
MKIIAKGGAAMNQVGLVGRITKDPLLKKLSEGR